MAKATQIHTKHPGETRNLAIDCTELLDSDETFTGTPTFSASGLTFSGAKTNSTAATIRNRTVAVGKALQASVSGGTAGVEYRCEASCSTTATPAQTIVVEFRLLVSDE